MWKENLRTLRYTSPNGNEFELDFGELSRSGAKKAPVTEFPGQDEASVQDLGNEAITIPISCTISGDDYDAEADRFWNALSEDGFGELEHPRWGNVTVLPSTREQTEQFVNGAGRAAFRIDFIRISDTAQEFPRARAAADDQVSSDVDTVGESLNAELEGTVLSEPREQATLKSQVLDTVEGFSDTFRDAAAQVDGLTQEIDAQVRTIQSDIDSLVTAPADLFESVITFYRLPARTAANVGSKLDAYRTLYDTLADEFRRTSTRYGELFGIVAASQINAVTAAAAESTVEGGLPTRGSAARAVDSLTSLDADAASLIAEIESNSGATAPYSVQADVARAVNRAAGSLIDRALSLPTERVLTLEQSYMPAALTDELWSDPDMLDHLIDYNNLSGDELFLIPAGREVRWYV